MRTSFREIFYTSMLALILSACEGDILFRTKACEEGTVRSGNECVAATKGGIGDCKDADLSKVQKGETVTMCDGSIGEGKLEFLSVCKADGEQNCITESRFKALDTSRLDPNKFVNGTKIAGVSGTMRARKQCRNYSSLTFFDSSYPPSNFATNMVTFTPAAVTTASDQIAFSAAHGLITNSPVRFTSNTTLPAPLVAGTTYYAIYFSSTVIRLASVPNGAQIDITSQGAGTHTAHEVADGTAQYFDTTDDYNNGATSSPTNNPWSTNDYLCDATNFLNVTTSSAPLLPSGQIPSTGNQPFAQIWQDQISGLFISNIICVNCVWSDAVRTCESLNGGTAGEGWRLPTQKELIQLYIHGISKVALSGGTTNVNFWSATGDSTFKNMAQYVFLSEGVSNRESRYDLSGSVLCLRP